MNSGTGGPGIPDGLLHIPSVKGSGNDSGRTRGGRPTRRAVSLRWRILVWISLVALGPLIIMAVQGYHCAREAIVESQTLHLRSVAESRRARLEAWLEEQKADFGFLSAAVEAPLASAPRDPKSPGQLPQTLVPLLDRIHQHHPSYGYVTLYDRDWNLLAHNTGMGDSEDEAPPLEFRAALEQRKDPLVAPAYLHSATPTRILLGSPVIDRGGRNLGYLVAHISPAESIFPILHDPTGLGRTGKAYVLHPDGRYMVPPPGAPGFAGRESPVPRAQFFPGSSSIRDYDDYRGVEVLGVAEPIPMLKGMMVIEIDQAEAFEWLGRLRARAATTAAVTLILILLVAVRSAAILSRPLRRLAEVSHRIAAGLHEARLTDPGSSEAQEVAAAFNRMLDELDSSHRKLVHAASLAAVGELSSTIVHEMRNPLSSVKMNVQALRRKVEGDPVHSELADIATQQVARLENMATDLLNYGKPLELHPIPIRFHEFTREVLRLIDGEAAGKRVAIRIEDGLERSEIMADAEQLRQALTNLLVNAVQASPEGGTVLVAARKEPGERAGIAISVSDEGPGIPEAQRDSLFKPFFTTRPGGTGLGLANVKKIVDYHGGSVTAENRPGGGAVFTIRLPAGGPPE